MAVQARTIEQITEDFSISIETLARFLNMRWKKEGIEPSPQHRERLEKIAYIDRRLRQVLKPDAIDRWLHAYNDSLGGKRPIDLLTKGQYDKLLSAIAQLEEGVFV
ncbi:MAG: DUF2384 domain-containing protein [Deltaproteobacteria bacterium]|nr:DUF2384 domain-containing protein [Deltaproteobacteria bacterium]